VPERFGRTLPAAQRDVRGVLAEICQWLRQRDYGADDLGTAELVLAEILNNIVEHAFAASAEGRIDIALRDTGGSLAVQVTDAGAGMPQGAPPSRGLPGVDGPRDTLPEGGFGWALIRQLSTDLDYRREAGQNRLSLTLARSPDAA
jgi:serine/threonine-protein kinase RsbW